MSLDSARKRYGVTLLVNLFRAGVSLLNTTIVPRALGPVNYGNYNFLFKTFGSIRGFLDFGTTAAFYTYSSKHIQSRKAFKIYYTWILIQLGLLIVFVVALPFLGIKNILFPGQEFKYIMIIGILEWFNFLTLMLTQFGESKAESVYVQKVNFIAQFVKTIGLLGLFWTGVLNLNSFITVSYATSLLAICWIGFFIVLNKDKYLARAPEDNSRKMIAYFVTFCTPLVVYNIVGLCFTFFDRWFLQTISGSVQQAYFSIAYQWSSVAFIFSSSMTNVYWRETSYALGQKDFERIKRIYTKLYMLLIFLSAFMAYFIALNANKLLIVFSGKDYANAQVVLVIMAFYSIYYTLGQINGTFFFAVEEVALYRTLGILGMLSEIVCTYFFLAPKKYMIPGLELSSMGLASKSLIMAIIFSNIQLYYVTKFMKIKFLTFLSKQAYIIVSVGLVALLTSYGMHFMKLGPILYIFVMFLIYLIMGGGLVFLNPEICGFNRAELVSYKDRLMAIIGRFKWKISV